MLSTTHTCDDDFSLGLRICTNLLFNNSILNNDKSSVKPVEVHLTLVTSIIVNPESTKKLLGNSLI